MRRSLGLILFVLVAAALEAQTVVSAGLSTANVFTNTDQFTLGITTGPIAFANLGTISTSTTLIFISDGTLGSNPCTGSGTGALAVRINGAWDCSRGSGGTVTSFSAGNLSPLFTTGVATGTTTPALSFSLSNAASNTLFGNFGGSSAGPSFNTINGGASCGDSTHALSYANGTGFGCQAITGSSGITGSGTTNEVPVFTGSSSVGNSNLSVTTSGAAITLTNTLNQTINNNAGALTIVGSNTSGGAIAGPVVLQGGQNTSASDLGAVLTVGGGAANGFGGIGADIILAAGIATGNNLGGSLIFTPATGGFGTGVVQINHGVGAGVTAGTGLQHVRTASCTTGSSAGSTCTTTVSWSQTFDSTAYTAACSVSGGTGSPTGTPYVLFTSGKSTTQITVTIANLTAVASSGTVDCMGMHD